MRLEEEGVRSEQSDGRGGPLILKLKTFSTPFVPQGRATPSQLLT